VISETLFVMFMTVSTSKRESHALAHAGQALEAHAGVDVLLLELGVVAVAVVVELGEDDVPDLDVAVAVAAGVQVGLPQPYCSPRS
jgi:hypothetical protein